MTRTNDLRTRERLETAHRARPPFQMLMVTFDALLLHLAPDVLDLRQDRSKRIETIRRSFLGLDRSVSGSEHGS